MREREELRAPFQFLDKAASLKNLETKNNFLFYAENYMEKNKEKREREKTWQQISDQKISSAANAIERRREREEERDERRETREREREKERRSEESAMKQMLANRTGECSGTWSRPPASFRKLNLMFSNSRRQEQANKSSCCSSSVASQHQTRVRALASRPSSSNEIGSASERTASLQSFVPSGSPEAPWTNLRDRNKNEEWRFSAITLSKILGDEAGDLNCHADWDSPVNASLLKELGEEGLPNYRQVVMKDGIAILDKSVGTCSSGVTLSPAFEGKAGSVLAFLAKQDEKRLESKDCPKKHFFDHLGDACTEQEHLVIHVEGTEEKEKEDEPHIVHIFHIVPKKEEESTVCWAPKCSVVVEGNQEVILVEEVVYEGEESGDPSSGARIVLPKTRVFLHPEASMKHLLVHSGSRTKEVCVRSLQITQEEKSSYELLESRVGYAEDPSVVSATNASLSRVEVDVWQTGEETKTDMNHLSLLSTSTESSSASSGGAGITHELRTKGRLDYRGGEINQVAKMVASGSASHCIFDGRVNIEKFAQETAADQIARGLLLTRRATINARPNLRIQADNVTAAHGCTIADLEEDQLFYLSSRGIEEKMARAVLIDSFIREITQLFGSGEEEEGPSFEKLAKRVDKAIEQALS